MYSTNESIFKKRSRLKLGGEIPKVQGWTNEWRCVLSRITATTKLHVVFIYMFVLDTWLAVLIERAHVIITAWFHPPPPSSIWLKTNSLRMRGEVGFYLSTCSCERCFDEYLLLEVLCLIQETAPSSGNYSRDRGCNSIYGVIWHLSFTKMLFCVELKINYGRNTTYDLLKHRTSVSAVSFIGLLFLTICNVLVNDESK